MLCDRSSQKSLRFTAMDSTGSGQVKIWLIMSRPQDIEIFNEALLKRVELQKNLHPDDPNNQNGNSDKIHKVESTECSTDGESEAKKSLNDDDEGRSAVVEPESA